MTVAKSLLEELVTANRILAREGVVDSFGHVSIRHPSHPDRYVMSRARAPECIEVDDLMEFALEGWAIDAAGRKAYAERFIHGAIYEARPEINAVVHNHSPSLIPFGVTGTRLRPVMHMCASMGTEVPTWDSRTQFGDTNLLVTNMEMARDLAAALGDRPVALMRGHGSVVAGPSLRDVVFNSVYLELNADLQMKAASLGAITFLSDGEIRAILSTRSSFTYERAWEYWCRRAGRPYDSRPMEGPLAGSA
jgi:HCOMODA/2-hydroxy-3-carboxy-muconic semialdehyde decarboxylase